MNSSWQIGVEAGAAVGGVRKAKLPLIQIFCSLLVCNRSGEGPLLVEVHLL